MDKKKEELNWSVDSKETVEFCELAGFDPSSKFVETALEDRLVYVQGRAGKESDFDALETACRSKKFAYKGFVSFGHCKTVGQAYESYQSLLTQFEEENHKEMYDIKDTQEFNTYLVKIRDSIPDLIEEIRAKRG